MPFIDTNHQRAAILVLVLGVALLIALTPYATGLIGIPVLYAVFAPAHDWLAKRASPRLAASLVVVLALFLIVVPGVSFAGLVVNQAQQIAGGVIQSPILGRLAQLKIGETDLGPRLAELGAQIVSWIGSSAFGLIGTAARVALNLTISLFGLFYLLLRPGETWAAVRPYIPFSAQNTEKLRQRFRDVTTSTIIGTGLTAAIQGTLVGLGFALAGIPNALFWGVVTMVFAILPVVGSGLWVLASRHPSLVPLPARQSVSRNQNLRSIAVRGVHQRQELLIPGARRRHVARPLRRPREPEEAARPARRLAQQRFVGPCRVRWPVELEQQIAEQLASGQHGPRRHGMLLGDVLDVRRGRGLADGLGGVARCAREPGTSRELLDFHLARPVRLLAPGCAERLLDLSQGSNLRAGKRRVAAARGAEGAGEVRDRLRRAPLGGRPHGEAHGLVPAAALQRGARRNRGERVGVRERADGILGGHPVHSGHDTLRLRVPTRLQVGVDQVVPRMAPLVPQGVEVALFLELPRQLRRAQVRHDVLVPQAQPSEDVRRHVLCVRHGRSDLGVAARGVQAEMRKLRHVVRVDQVVGEPRMLGLRLEERLEDRVSALLKRKRRVRSVRLTEGDERQRVEDPRFAVPGIAALDIIHRLRVGDEPGLGIEGRVLGVVAADRLEVVALARRPGEGEAPGRRGAAAQ